MDKFLITVSTRASLGEEAMARKAIEDKRKSTKDKPPQGPTKRERGKSQVQGSGETSKESEPENEAMDDKKEKEAKEDKKDQRGKKALENFL